MLIPLYWIGEGELFPTGQSFHLISVLEQQLQQIVLGIDWRQKEDSTREVALLVLIYKCWILIASVSGGYILITRFQILGYSLWFQYLDLSEKTE